jgi:hypothetical protein
MKAVLLPAALAVAVMGLAFNSTPAPAKGCIKGAIVGGVAGHYAGHHGLLGATGGCIVGHHMANKHARERAYQEQSNTSSLIPAMAAVLPIIKTHAKPAG